MEEQLIQVLKRHQLRLTSIRKEVLALFLERQEALSQHDLEEALGEVDRITLYRTLRSFEEKGLIHRAIDGTEKLRFALCQGLCTAHTHQDDHAHFHCEQCSRTLCLEGTQLPELNSPPGYKINQTHLILQGICADCQMQQA